MILIFASVGTVETVTYESVRADFLMHPVTITVRTLRAQNNGSEMAVGIVLDNGEHREQKSLVLTMEQYCEYRPSCGVIDEETYERLEEAAELCRAMRCGENLLSYGANSEQMLARKLARKGFSREVAQRAVAKLSELGLIREEEDLKREVERSLCKLWGKKRIAAHLWNRGFGEDAMKTLPELLQEVDFAENCAILIKKHYGSLPQDRQEQSRMIASLSRYGYTLQEIRDAIQKIHETA